MAKRINVKSNHDSSFSNSQTSNTLTVVNPFDESVVQIPLEGNALKASGLGALRTPQGNPLRIFDPGYRHTICCRSKISFIDGSQGILRYRGIPIESIAEKWNFEEVILLLLYGNCNPQLKEITHLQSKYRSHLTIPMSVSKTIRAFQCQAHPMSMLIAGMANLGSTRPSTNPAIAGANIYQDANIRTEEINRILGASVTLAAMIFRHSKGLPPIEPKSNAAYVENFVHMCGIAQSATPAIRERVVRFMETLFIIHAEHELNCSTAAVMHIASAQTDIYSCLCGAVAALYGPRHGGANEAVIKMLKRIRFEKNVPLFLNKVKSKQEKLMGFGHRIYKSYDPRAKILRIISHEIFQLFGSSSLIKIAKELERAALSDTFFISRNLYPNVDFYSGLIYEALGFHCEFFPILFALPRIVGWLSHWNEFTTDPDNAIWRPHQLYEGSSLKNIAKSNL